jgi:hypothetical protein
MIDFVLSKNLSKYAKEFNFTKVYSIDEINAVEGKTIKLIGEL